MASLLVFSRSAANRFTFSTNTAKLVTWMLHLCWTFTSTSHVNEVDLERFSSNTCLSMRIYCRSRWPSTDPATSCWAFWGNITHWPTKYRKWTTSWYTTDSSHRNLRKKSTDPVRRTSQLGEFGCHQSFQASFSLFTVLIIDIFLLIFT